MYFIEKFNKIPKVAHDLLTNESGVTATEYALIALAVVVTGLAVIGTIGTQIDATFTTILNKL